MIPIPFYGWLEIDQEDKESMLREQIHAQQAEIKALRTALMYVRPKDLTDKEIDELAHEYNCIDDYPHEFVRACIRKAQEK